MPTLIVFDLNGIFAKTQGKGKYSVRPHLAEFTLAVDHLISQGDIEIAFWTSKPEDNGKPILEGILGQTLLKKALFTWYRDECTPVIIDGNPYHTRKDLRRIWARYPQYTERDTYLVDDSPSKCADFPNNLIQAPPYLGPRKAPDDQGFQEILDQIKEKVKVKAKT